MEVEFANGKQKPKLTLKAISRSIAESTSAKCKQSETCTSAAL